MFSLKEVRKVEIFLLEVLIVLLVKLPGEVEIKKKIFFRLWFFKLFLFKHEEGNYSFDFIYLTISFIFKKKYLSLDKILLLFM